MATLIGLNLVGDVLSRSAMLAANQATAASMRGAADAVNAAEAVVGLGMLQRLVGRWRVVRSEVAGLVHRALLRARAVSAVTAALRAAMTGAMVGLGLVLALNGSIESGSMVAGNMVLGRLLMPFASIAATKRQWVDVYAAWRRVCQALEAASPRRNAPGLPTPEPRLVVENLGLIAPGGEKVLLRGVAFDVAPGEAVALIGPSSSGKSTLLRLLVGMMPPTTGGAYLDGSSTYLWDREDLARHIGYVPQRPTLARRDRRRQHRPHAGARPARRDRRRQARRPAPDHRPPAARLRDQIVRPGPLRRPAAAPRPGARALPLAPAAAARRAERLPRCRGRGPLIECLAALKREGTTIVLATHRPPLLAFVDKVVVLEEGMVSRIGPAADVTAETAPRIRRVPAAALADAR